MTVEALLAFNLVLLAAMASPGPAFVYALHMAATGGFRAGLAAGAGLGLVAALWTGAALLGLDAVFRLFPWAYGVLRVAGAAYLIWIAVQTWRAAGTPPQARAPAARRAFRGGMLVNLGNPKSVLFAAAVLVVLFPNGLTPFWMAVVVANHLAVEILVYGGLAALAASPPAAAAYLRAKRAVDRITAAILGALGVRLLMEARHG